MRPYGHPLRAAFYAYLPEGPRGRYVTRADARLYADRIRTVLEMDQGGESDVQWTPKEKDRLRTLYAKWDRRARGLDLRFNAMGVSAGTNDRYRAKTRGEWVMEQLQRLTHPL